MQPGYSPSPMYARGLGILCQLFLKEVPPYPDLPWNLGWKRVPQRLLFGFLNCPLPHPLAPRPRRVIRHSRP